MHNKKITSKRWLRIAYVAVRTLELTHLVSWLISFWM
jgi:hypothetical protein